MSDNIQESIQALALLAARRAAESFAGYEGPAVTPEHLIRAVIQRLPPEGRIRKKQQRLVITGLSYLIQEVPSASPDRPELEAAVRRLVERSS